MTRLSCQKDERVEVIETALDREANARFSSRIVVHPVGWGRRVSVSERVDVYFVGAEEPAPPLPEPMPEELAALGLPGLMSGE